MPSSAAVHINRSPKAFPTAPGGLLRREGHPTAEGRDYLAHRPATAPLSALDGAYPGYRNPLERHLRVSPRAFGPTLPAPRPRASSSSSGYLWAYCCTTCPPSVSQVKLIGVSECRAAILLPLAAPAPSLSGSTLSLCSFVGLIGVLRQLTAAESLQALRLELDCRTVGGQSWETSARGEIGLEVVRSNKLEIEAS